jgi:hypothetical protein
MAPAKLMDSVTLGCIALAERSTTPINEANVAALKVFQRLRTQGISLTDRLAQNAASQTIVADQPSSILMVQKLQLTAEVKDLKAIVVTLRDKISSHNQNLGVAKEEIRQLRVANKTAEAKVSAAVASALKASKAEIETKAELKSVRAEAAADQAALDAERAKPALISADDLAALKKEAREQQAEITALKEALAKAEVQPAAHTPHSPDSVPPAPASISKRSQAALKAWITRRANSAAQTVAPAPAPEKARKAQSGRAPRETIRTRVVEILKSCSGMSLDAQALGERLASNLAYRNKGYGWHSRLSGQLRTEVLGQMESLRKFGVTVISVPFGTRMTHRFVWTGRGGEGTRIKPTYSFLMNAAKFKGVREMVRGLIDPATWSVTGGRRKGVNSVRVWVADANAATAFNIAF